MVNKLNNSEDWEHFYTNKEPLEHPAIDYECRRVLSTEEYKPLVRNQVSLGLTQNHIHMLVNPLWPGLGIVSFV